MIGTIDQLPLLTLVVTLLGVINTVMASVRARRWELGVLRSVGLIRSGLLRLILAFGAAGLSRRGRGGEQGSRSRSLDSRLRGNDKLGLARRGRGGILRQAEAKNNGAAQSSLGSRLRGNDKLGLSPQGKDVSQFPFLWKEEAYDGLSKHARRRV